MMDNEVADNWEHKSTMMTCQMCMWYVPKSGTYLGRCRKRSPELGGFPAVFATDFCGDHKLDAERLPKVPQEAA